MHLSSWLNCIHTIYTIVRTIETARQYEDNGLIKTYDDICHINIVTSLYIFS